MTISYEFCDNFVYNLSESYILCNLSDEGIDETFGEGINNNDATERGANVPENEVH